MSSVNVKLLNPYTKVRGGRGGWTGGHRPPGSQAQAEEGGQTQVSCDWLGAGHVTSVLSPDWSIVQAQERDQGEDLRGDLGGWRQVSGVSARVLGRKI